MSNQKNENTMKTTITDNRTEDQKSTHYYGVVARDKALSHWGQARGGISRAAWACQSKDDASKIFDWVKARSEMKNVIITDLRNYFPPEGDSHLDIYVVNSHHPVLRQ